MNDPKFPVATIYDLDSAVKYHRLMTEFKGGNAVFTFPPQPFKCGGAPQKITYLSEAHWRKSGVREKTNISYFT